MCRFLNRSATPILQNRNDHISKYIPRTDKKYRHVNSVWCVYLSGVGGNIQIHMRLQFEIVSRKKSLKKTICSTSNICLVFLYCMLTRINLAHFCPLFRKSTCLKDDKFPFVSGSGAYLNNPSLSSALQV